MSFIYLKTKKNFFICHSLNTRTFWRKKILFREWHDLPINLFLYTYVLLIKKEKKKKKYLDLMNLLNLNRVSTYLVYKNLNNFINVYLI